MAGAKTRNTGKRESLDLAGSIPELKRDVELLMLGLQEARVRIADWLGVRPRDVKIEVAVFDDQVRSRLAMPADTVERLHGQTRQLRVYRQDRDLEFCVVEHYDPPIDEAAAS